MHYQSQGSVWYHLVSPHVGWCIYPLVCVELGWVNPVLDHSSRLPIRSETHAGLRWLRNTIGIFLTGNSWTDWRLHLNLGEVRLSWGHSPKGCLRYIDPRLALGPSKFRPKALSNLSEFKNLIRRFYDNSLGVNLFSFQAFLVLLFQFVFVDG